MSQNLSFKMLERYNHSMEKKDNDEINAIDIEHVKAFTITLIS